MLYAKCSHANNNYLGSVSENGDTTTRMIYMYIYGASHTGIIYHHARISAKRRETRDKFGLQIIRKIDLVIAAGIMARWRSHLLYRLYRRRRSLLLCPFPTGYRRRTLLSVEMQKKIRDLTATIYTKERCRKACRKCTTPRMAFSRIYFYRVKTFVVAFVDESILFQVPLAPYRFSLPCSFQSFLMSLAFTILIFHLEFIQHLCKKGSPLHTSLYSSILDEFYIRLLFLSIIGGKRITSVPRLLSWSSTTTADIMKTLPTLPPTAREANNRSRATLDQADDKVTGETSRSPSMTPFNALFSLISESAPTTLATVLIAAL